MRADYSNSYKYYQEVVSKPHNTKRDLETRDFGSSASQWKTLIAPVRQEGTTSQDAATIGMEDFNALLVADNGSSNQCGRSSKKRSGASEGFVKLGLSGSMRNTMDFGATVCTMTSKTS